MTDTSAAEVPAGAVLAPGATPAGAYAYFTSPDGSVAWLDLPASYDDPPVGFIRVVAGDPDTTYTFEDGKAWAAEVDRRDLQETEAPVETDPAVFDDGQNENDPPASTPPVEPNQPNDPPATPPLDKPQQPEEPK
jgi:hypothetical protein